MIEYIACFIIKAIIGLCAISIFYNNPNDERLGYIIGAAIGITLGQYAAHYI